MREKRERPFKRPYKKSSPFGFVKTPFDPVIGHYYPLVGSNDSDLEALEAAMDAIQIQMFAIIDEPSANMIHCILIKNGEETKVCKPWLLMADAYNGKTINGVSYSMQGNDRRKATSGSESEVQIITPDYQIGEFIMATPVEAVTIGLPSDWMDINVAGRCWAAELEEED